MPAADLELVAVAEANGRFAITARLNGESLTDRLLITSAKSRGAFVKCVCEHWPSIAPLDVGTLLEKLAREHVEARAARPDTAADGELDAATVFRPEQFFTPDVSGMAIPVIGEHDGRPVGRWVLLLQRADGHRERRDLTGRLSLPDDKTLWLAPTPAEPSPMQARSLCGWSAAGRRAWLDGTAAPNPVDVFRRACEQVATYLDLGPPDAAAGTTATLALWVFVTYLYSVFDAVPYLYIGAPSAPAAGFSTPRRRSRRGNAPLCAEIPPLESTATLRSSDAASLRSTSQVDARRLRPLALLAADLALPVPVLRLHVGVADRLAVYRDGVEAGARL
jgi:hypothetical protein